MQIQDYPKAIFKIQTKILDLSQEIRTLSETSSFCLSAIDRQIAFDQTLKNDAQRKAKRAELMETDTDYISAALTLRETSDRRDRLDVELQRLRNEFTVAKLELRDRIAQLELHTAS